MGGRERREGKAGKVQSEPPRGKKRGYEKTLLSVPCSEKERMRNRKRKLKKKASREEAWPTRAVGPGSSQEQIPS